MHYTQFIWLNNTWKYKQSVWQLFFSEFIHSYRFRVHFWVVPFENVPPNVPEQQSDKSAMDRIRKCALTKAPFCRTLVRFERNGFSWLDNSSSLQRRFCGCSYHEWTNLGLFLYSFGGGGFWERYAAEFGELHNIPLDGKSGWGNGLFWVVLMVGICISDLQKDRSSTLVVSVLCVVSYMDKSITFCLGIIR